jgi:hypothetical protein
MSRLASLRCVCSAGFPEGVLIIRDPQSSAGLKSVAKRSARFGLPALLVVAVLALSFIAKPVAINGNLVSLCGYLGAPAVSGISPVSGSIAGGTVVTLTGCGFTGATSVHFGATTAAFTIVSDTQIHTTSPAHVAGLVDVTVTNPSGTSALNAPADQFEFIAPNSHCTAAFVSPSSGTFGAGTMLLFTASSHGCLGPRYAFWIQSPDATWHFKQDFPSATYTWDTSGLVGVYNIHVWVNVSGSSFDAVGAGTVTITACSAGSLSPAAPTQQVGTTVNFTAGSSGCATPRYAYWVQYPDMSWHFVRGFGAAAFAWSTAGLAPGVYTVHSWVNTAGTGFDTFGSSTVTLTGCATASLAPPTTSGARGITVNFTASSTGCTSPRYAFWVQYPDLSWHFVRDFDGATFGWITTGLPAAGTYTVHVWANVTGNSFDAVGSATVTLT